jgi:hypothetical protein
MLRHTAGVPAHRDALRAGNDADMPGLGLVRTAIEHGVALGADSCRALEYLMTTYMPAVRSIIDGAMTLDHGFDALGKRTDLLHQGKIGWARAPAAR